MNQANPMQSPDSAMALYLRGFSAPLWTLAAIAAALLMLA